MPHAKQTLSRVYSSSGGGLLPVKVKNFLRLIEYKSGLHKKHSARNVTLSVNMTDAERAAVKKILIIDDSVDTGASMLSVYNAVRDAFPASEIYTYALNVFTESEKLIKIDFFTIRDSIIRTPMSKDSQEHGEFLKMCSEHGITD